MKLSSLFHRAPQPKIETHSGISLNGNSAVIDKIIFDEDGNWCGKVASDILYVANRYVLRANPKGQPMQLLVFCKRQLLTPEQWGSINTMLTKLCETRDHRGELPTAEIVGELSAPPEAHTGLYYTFQERTT